MRGPIRFSAANEEGEREARVGQGRRLSTLGWGGVHSQNSLVYLQCLAPPYRVTKLLLQL